MQRVPKVMEVKSDNVYIAVRNQTAVRVLKLCGCMVEDGCWPQGPAGQSRLSVCESLDHVTTTVGYKGFTPMSM